MAKRKERGIFKLLVAVLLVILSASAALILVSGIADKVSSESKGRARAEAVGSGVIETVFPLAMPRPAPAAEFQSQEGGRILARLNWTDSAHASVIVHSGLDRASAEDLIGTKALLLKSIFLPVASPYPGAITREFFCANETRPVQVSSAPDAVAFLLGAGSRRNYGICLPEEIRYNSTYVLAYCPGTNEVFEVKAFAQEGYANGLETALTSEKLCPKV